MLGKGKFLNETCSLMAPASGAGLPSVLEETATLGTFLEQIIEEKL